MPDTARMRQRIAYLRKQSALYRRLARLPCNAPLHERFEALARQCGEIAATIERNLAKGLYDRR